MSNTIVENVNEEIFTEKLEEYNNLLLKRDDIKSSITNIRNAINSINDFKNEEYSCKYEHPIDWNLNLRKITKDELSSFTFWFNPVIDKDIVINMLKGVIDAYKIRYVDINKRIKEFDFLEVK